MIKTVALSFFIYLFGSFSNAQNSPDGSVIKVLSFNIYHGETMDGSYDLDKIAKVILSANPDFVSLQEVDFKTERNEGEDLVVELACRTGMIPLFGKAMNQDSGEYGNGILSKSTFIKSRILPLPFTEGREPRSALEISAEISSGDTISFIATHLDYPLDYNGDRIMQVKKINEEFLSNKYPAILAGDLNDYPKSEVISILEEFWLPAYDPSRQQPTFPSNKPERKIDYIMAQPKNGWEILDRKVLCDSIASDHCAYLVEIKLLK